MLVHEIVTRTATLRLEGDGILRYASLRGVEETLDDAQRTVAAIMTLTAGTPRPVLADVRALKAQTRDVRSFYVNSEATTVISAAALLVGSPMSRAIANSLVIFTKPGIPVRLFATEATALDWLKTFLQ